MEVRTGGAVPDTTPSLTVFPGFAAGLAGAAAGFAGAGGFSWAMAGEVRTAAKPAVASQYIRCTEIVPRYAVPSARNLECWSFRWRLCGHGISARKSCTRGHR